MKFSFDFSRTHIFYSSWSHSWGDLQHVLWRRLPVGQHEQAKAHQTSLRASCTTRGWTLNFSFRIIWIFLALSNNPGKIYVWLILKYSLYFWVYLKTSKSSSIYVIITQAPILKYHSGFFLILILIFSESPRPSPATPSNYRHSSSRSAGSVDGVWPAFFSSSFKVGEADKCILRLSAQVTLLFTLLVWHPIDELFNNNNKKPYLTTLPSFCIRHAHFSSKYPIKRITAELKVPYFVRPDFEQSYKGRIKMVFQVIFFLKFRNFCRSKTKWKMSTFKRCAWTVTRSRIYVSFFQSSLFSVFIRIYSESSKWFLETFTILFRTTNFSSFAKKNLKISFIYFVEHTRFKWFVSGESKMHRARWMRDEQMLRDAEKMPMPNCNKLNEIYSRWTAKGVNNLNKEQVGKSPQYTDPQTRDTWLHTNYDVNIESKAQKQQLNLAIPNDREHWN